MGAASGKSNQGMSGDKISYSRRALHAGSWYSDVRLELDSQLGTLLSAAEHEINATQSPEGGPLRAVICPHAGYSYSGPTAAFSYHHLAVEMRREDSPVQKILILHPSHHVYLDGCAVSGASHLETPVGNLEIDEDLRDEILRLSSRRVSFEIMKKDVDEREHSGEMQYPYIAKALREANKLERVKVLPVMCGGISASQEEEFGKLLAPIIARPEVLCVISTDFCHWGSRFQYQPTGNGTSQAIHEFIKDLDHRGMQHIEMDEPGAFAKYLKETRNTICGRHAIGVWLNAVHANNPSRETLDISFVKYDQSSQVQSLRESSVSYASATARQRQL